MQLRTCPHMCKVRSTSEKSSVPTLLSDMQLHVPIRNFVVATAALLSVIFFFHNNALSCFMVKETFRTPRSATRNLNQQLVLCQFLIKKRVLLVVLDEVPWTLKHLEL